MDEGDLAGAAAHLERSRALASSLDWGWWEAIGLTMLVDVQRRAGDLPLAERYGREALRLLAAQESRVWCVTALGALGQVALARGDLARAGMLWGAMSAEGIRMPLWDARQERWAGALVDEGRPEFLEAANRAHSLDLWDAVAIALDEPESPQTVP